MIALMLGLAQAISDTPADAKPACAPGVYMAGRDAAIPEIVVEKRKVGNLAGAVFLSPFAAGKLKIKSVVPGASAQLRVADARPSFRFCFATRDAAAGDYVGAGVGASTAADYRLVRLVTAGDNRELELAAVGGFGGGGSSLAKAVVPVDVVTDQDGSVRVQPRGDLPPGEYGFILVAGSKLMSARKQDVNERVVDFAIIPR